MAINKRRRKVQMQIAFCGWDNRNRARDRAVRRSHSITEGQNYGSGWHCTDESSLRSTYYALLTTLIVKIVNGNSNLVYDYPLISEYVAGERHQAAFWSWKERQKDRNAVAN